MDKGAWQATVHTMKRLRAHTVLSKSKEIENKQVKSKESEDKNERFLNILNVLNLFVGMSRLVNSTGFFC